MNDVLEVLFERTQAIQAQRGDHSAAGRAASIAVTQCREGLKRGSQLRATELMHAAVNSLLRVDYVGPWKRRCSFTRSELVRIIDNDGAR